MSITIKSRESRFANCTFRFPMGLPLNLFYLWSQVRWTEEGIRWNNINKLSTCLQLNGRYFIPSYFKALLLGSHDFMLSVCFSLSLVVSRLVRYWKWSDVRRFKSKIPAWNFDWRESLHSFPPTHTSLQSRRLLRIFKASYNVAAGLYLYVLCPCIKEYLYYVTNQQKHINNIFYFIIYYCWPTCFGRFCGHYLDVEQE